MMYCEKCGNKLVDGAAFCGYCGANNAHEVKTKCANKNRRITLITVSVMLIAVIAVLAYVFRDRLFAMGNEHAVITSVGFSGIDSDEEYIYYIDYVSPYANEDLGYETRIYRMEHDGGNRELINTIKTDGYNSWIKVVDDKIYVYSYFYNLEEMNKNGSGLKTIVLNSSLESSPHPVQIQKVGDKLYYNVLLVNSDACIAEEDNIIIETIQSLVGDCDGIKLTSVYYCDNKAYVSAFGYVIGGAVVKATTFELDLTTGKYEEILSEGVTGLCYYEDYMYFVTLDGVLSRCRKDGTERIKFGNVMTDRYCIRNEDIYFTDTVSTYLGGTEYYGEYSVSETICRCNLDGSGREVIVENGNLLGIAEDWMLFFDNSTGGTKMIELTDKQSNISNLGSTDDVNILINNMPTYENYVDPHCNSVLNIIALNASGDILWESRKVSPVVTAEMFQAFDIPGYVCVLNDRIESCLYALDRNTGSEIWKISGEDYSDMGLSEGMKIESRNGVIYLTSKLGYDTITAIDAESGAQVWECTGLWPEEVNQPTGSVNSIELKEDLIRVYWEDLGDYSCHWTELSYDGVITGSGESESFDPHKYYFSSYSSSSSILNGVDEYHARKAFDLDYSTCWQENVAGSGINEWIMASADKSSEVTGLIIQNGYSVNEDAYYRNGRAKRICVEADGFTMEYVLHDIYGQANYIVFENPVKTDFIKITILDAISGSEWDDTAISEIIICR